MESNHLNQSTTPCYHVFAQLFNLEPSFLGKDVQFAGSLFPLQPLHFTAKTGAPSEDRTQDLLFTKEVRYHCAKGALIFTCFESFELCYEIIKVATVRPVPTSATITIEHCFVLLDLRLLGGYSFFFLHLVAAVRIELTWSHL